MIQFQKNSNYIIAAVFAFLAYYLVTKGLAITEAIIISSAIGVFLILINSNMLFKEFDKKRLHKHYKKSMKSHYFELLNTSFGILLFVIAYYLYAHSSILSNLLVLIGVSFLFGVPYYINYKKKQLLNKKGDLVRSSILAYYFILPLMASWYIILILFEAELYSLFLIVLIYLAVSITAGYIKLRIYG